MKEFIFFRKCKYIKAKLLQYQLLFSEKVTVYITNFDKLTETKKYV